MKTSFKKIFAGILSTAMLASTLSFVTVSAAGEQSFEYNQNNQSAMALADTSEAATTGTVTWGQEGTKGKNNQYAEACSVSSGEFRLVRQNTQWEKSESANYLVLTAQIMPETTDITKLYWGTNGNTSISSDANGQKTIAASLVQNQWNTITTVYKWDGSDVQTYVNGTSIYQGTPQSVLMDDSGNKKRIQFHVYAASGTSFGLDNIRMYQTSEVPDTSLPALDDSENYSISDREVVIAPLSTLTAGDLSGNGESVTVYSNNNFEKIVDGTEILKDGNVIVVLGWNGEISYYTVNKKGKRVDVFRYDEDNRNSLSFASAAHGSVEWVENGINGKTDGYGKVTSGSADYSTGKETRLQYSSWTRDENCKYLVLTAQILPQTADDIRGIMWATNGSVSVSVTANAAGFKTVTDQLKANQWNTVTTVYDLDNPKTYAATYVNGVLAMTNTNPGSPINQRIQLHVLAANENVQYGLDNVYCYQTNTLPDVSMPELSDGANYIAATNEMGIAEGKTVTVNEIVVDDQFNAYRDNTYAEAMSDNEQLSDGNVIVVYNDNGYTYYTVKTNYKGITECMTLDTTPETGGVDFDYPTGVSGEWVKGIGGKTADDESCKIEWTANGFVNVNSKFIWKQQNQKSRYLVFEANIMPCGEVKNARFAVENAGANLSYAPNNAGLNSEKWNKIVTVLYLDDYNVAGTARRAETYLNGTKITNDSNGTTQWSVFGLGENTRNSKLRIVGVPNNVTNGTFYIDDLKVYESVFEPVVSVPSELPDALITGSFVYDKEYGNIRGSQSSTAADAVAAYENAQVVSGISTKTEGTIQAGDALAIVNANNDFKYYTFAEPYGNYEVMLSGEAYDKAANKIKSGTLNITVPVENVGDSVILADYDADGVLQKINIQAAEKAGLQNFVFNSAQNKGGRSAIFVWNGIDRMLSNTAAVKLDYFETDQTIACWGASMTFGQGADNAETESYPAVLANLSGKTVYKMGIGGETMYTIAARQGAINIVTKNDFTIPAGKTAVNIDFAAEDGGVIVPRNPSIGGWNPITIAGVEGWISVDSKRNTNTGMYELVSAQFTRNEAGEAINVAKGTKIVTDASELQADVNVFLVGMNGGWTSANQALSTNNDPSGYVNTLNKMLEKIPGGKTDGKYVIIGITNDGNWSALYQALQETYGEHFLDVKSYLASAQALSDAGIQATTDDESRIQEGSVCASLLNDYANDKVHLNTAGYKLLGQKVFEKLQQLEYIK